MITGGDTLVQPGALEMVRTGVVARLRARLPAIEKGIFASLRSGPSDPAGSGDVEYVRGLRVAIVAALDYALTGMEKDDDWSGPIPSAVTAQARRAARSGVGLETVLLRYTVGNRILSDFVMEEVDRFPSQALREVMSAQGALVESLMAGVSAEYKLEVERAGRSLEQRRGERILRLLAGEYVACEAYDYDYRFEDAWHLGMIMVGGRVREAVRSLGAGWDRDVLSVGRDETTMWVWLGGRDRSSIVGLESRLSNIADMGVSVALGEPSSGIQGWRLTHRQAQSALLVALHQPRGITRYAENMLLATALQDETLATSLQEIYMAPLASQRDGGAVLRETLCRYFEVAGNAATAAAILKVDRHTVERRLQKIEDKLGRMLCTCQAELEVALRLHELAPSRAPGDARVEDTGANRPALNSMGPPGALSLAECAT